MLEILARYPLGRGHRLILLKLGRRILLLHQNGSAMTTLTELCNEDDVALLMARIEAGSRERLSTRFQKALTRANRGHEGFRDRFLSTETVDLTRVQSVREHGSSRRRQVHL